MQSQAEQIFGLQPGEIYTLSAEALQKRYFGLCKQHHPDSKDKATHALSFAEVEKAYQTLKTVLDQPLPIQVTLSELYHGSSRHLFNGDVVVIPAGTYSHTILTSRQGRQVEINEVPGMFLRQGDDLYYHCHISLAQALMGSPVTISHPLGNLKIPVQIPNTDYNHVEPGYGMPIPGPEPKTGSLYVVYHVTFPERINPEAVRNLSWD